MNAFRFARATAAVVSGATLVWVAASCASSDDAPSPLPFADGGSADTSTIIDPGPDAAALHACTDGRWCAVAPPVDTPVSFNGIWGSGPNDVWMIASPDIAIHWNGLAFEPTHLGTKQTVFGVWGSTTNDVWAFSTGDALWHNASSSGASWSAGGDDAGITATPGVVAGMWGASSADVWAVGRVGATADAPATVWHCEGWNNGIPNWIPTMTTPGANPWDAEPSFNAIWGSDGEVWVVGEGGKTRYSSGWANGAATWTIVDSGTSLPLYALWGVHAGDVWAAGSGGVVRHFTKQVDGTIATQDVAFPSRATIRTLSGFGESDIWAAGSDGTLAHWDGALWSLVDLGDALAKDSEIFAVWASGPDDIWAVGRNTFLHKGERVLPGTTP